MSLDAGRKLGPYEILSPIGSGGMGEVYKAQDTRLDRMVAIKVLPEHLALDDTFRARFEREAKTISGLNHPHICTLYDVGREDGVDYLVMELLDGETVQERLKRGALPLEDVLTYGTQIAGALDRAHREGIVHRDLKPGNIFVTPSGAKLLDFGLAKQRAGDAPDVSNLSALPTEQRSLTQAGAVLGTFQYMSPEQLAGNDADARSDIFALGAVLYEMATGKKAFEAPSQAHLITAIMSQAPPTLSSVGSKVPAALERCVAKCLAKDPDARWHSAHDLRDELEWIAAGDTEEATTPATKQAGRVGRLLGVASGIVLGAVVATLVTGSRTTSLPRHTTRFAVELPGVDALRNGGLALSPDGGDLVYVDGNQLYRRPMGALEATAIAGTEAGQYPFFSPDGKWIGFFADGFLKKVALSGGPPVTICEAGFRYGASWGVDDTIVFAHRGPGAQVLFRVPASGGTPKVFSSL